MRLFIAGLLLLLAGSGNAAFHGSTPVPPINLLVPGNSWTGTDGCGGTCNPPSVDATVQGQQTITGAASHSGLIQLTVGSTSKMTSNDIYTVAGVTGTTEANATWLITVIDGTHVDLQGSTFTNAYSSGGTIGFNETAIADFDEFSNVVVEGSNEYVTIGAAIGNRAWISKVRCYLEGNTSDITAQSVNPKTGDMGWNILIQAPSTQNGDAVLTCDAYPVNGVVKRIAMNMWLDSASSGANFVNREQATIIYVNSRNATSGALGPGVDPAGSTQGTTISTDATGKVVTFSSTVTITTNEIVAVSSGGNVAAWSQPDLTVTGQATGCASTTTCTMASSLGANLSGASWSNSTACGSSPGTGTNPGSSLHPYATLRTAVNCTAAPALANSNGGLVVAADSSINGSTSYTEPVLSSCVGGTCKGTSRMIEVRPYTTGQTYKVGLLYRGVWSLPTQMVEFTRAAVDMGTVMEVQGCAGGACVATLNGVQQGAVTVFNQSTLNDSNGPTGPAYGYYAGATFSMAQTPFVTTAVSGINRMTAIVDSSMSTINSCGAVLIRNTTGTIPWDVNFQNTGTINTAYFNFTVNNPNAAGIYQLLAQRLTLEPQDGATTAKLPPISNTPVFSGGNTTFTITSAQGTSVVNNGSATFESGALSGQTFTLVSYTPGTTTAVVSGDASAAVNGDLVFLHEPAHADANQVGIMATGASVLDLNFYGQRYSVFGDNQQWFNQPGSYQGAGTLTSVGTAVTISTTNSTTPTVGDFINITGAGSNIHQYRQITVVTDPQHVTIDQPFSPDISVGVGWAQGKTSKDYACIACRLGGNSLNAADEGQFQHGAEHWVIVQNTTNATREIFRSANANSFSGGQGPGFGLKNFVIYDGLFGQGASQGGSGSLTADNPPDWSGMTGFALDTNNYLSNADNAGTNVTTQAATIADGTFEPSGLTATMRGMRGNPHYADGTPLFLWGADGSVLPVNGTALVGALQATTCPQGTAVADGCGGANINATLKHPNFFTSYANQSSQTYTTRPPWNVAGVDYPVGVPSNIIFKDPTVDTLPTGCTYTSATHRVNCQGVSNDITFDGWDFSLHNGIFLNVSSTYTGTNFTLTNSKFTYGSNFTTQFYLVQFPSTGGPTNIVISNCTIDDGGTNWTESVTSGAGPANTINTVNAPNVTITYSAFLGITTRAFGYSAPSGGKFISKYNYYEGLNYPAAQITATIDNGSGTGSPSGNVLTVTGVAAGTILNGTTVEFPGNVTATTITGLGTGTGGTGTYTLNRSTSATSETMYTYANHGDGHLIQAANNIDWALYQVSFSTFLGLPINNAGTAWITPFESNSTGVTLDTWQLDHSTLISNTANIGGVSIAYLAGDNHSLAFGSIPITSNYWDPTGSFGCLLYVGTGATPTMTGNVDLLDGSAVTSTSGACFGHQ